MSIKNVLGISGLLLALSAPAVSFAAPTGGHCALREHHVTAVKPYKDRQQVGRAGAIERLRGAELFVQAEPGLTAEWLQLELSRHIAMMKRGSGMKDCPLDNVQVRVDSAGTGFSVKLIARDADQANQVLSSARILLSG